MAERAGSRVVAILKSSDVRRTADWYTRVGFVLNGRVSHSTATWCELERDGTVLQFLGGDTPWPGSPAFTGCLYVHCDDVDAVFDAVRDRVDVEWGVEEREWGARELVLRDPDGYFVTFTQPTSTVIKDDRATG